MKKIIVAFGKDDLGIQIEIWKDTKFCVKFGCQFADSDFDSIPKYSSEFMVYSTYEPATKLYACYVEYYYEFPDWEFAKNVVREYAHFGNRSQIVFVVEEVDKNLLPISTIDGICGTIDDVDHFLDPSFLD
jgi:hypothetical protein